jgi:hypothetical protein
LFVPSQHFILPVIQYSPTLFYSPILLLFIPYFLLSSYSHLFQQYFLLPPFPIFLLNRPFE